MEQVIQAIGEGYVIVTLACVIIGYLITTTPYLQRAKDFVPVIVTVVGLILGVALYGADIEVATYGMLAGLLSTGLYELFGKGLKSLGELLEKRGVDFR